MSPISSWRRLRWVLIPLDVLGVLLLLFLLLWSRYYHIPPPSFVQTGPDRPALVSRDAAAHFDVANEWWYYTGHLRRDDGVRYGFELVFFKSYLPPEWRLGPLPLRWLVSPGYLAHFAITEEATGQFTHFERSNIPFFWRGGADDGRFTVWAGEWGAAGNGGVHHLRAAGGEYSLRLDLRAEGDAPVLHGRDGLVAMGTGGYSSYTSYPRMTGSGTLEVAGHIYRVEALTWMDHQWGSWNWAAFAGWDWAGLQLDDGSALMIFRFRGAGGQAGSLGGTYVAPGGRAVPLTESDIRVRDTAYWVSPETGGTYPAGWEVEVPSQGLRLVIAPTVSDQEVVSDLTPIYWEGSVTVAGQREDRPLGGVGYIELTGYAQRGTK